MSTPGRPGPDLRDPRTLRALAHPTRLALLEALAAEPTATATRCAELVGESVQSCSFHLRTLARYGFIEMVPSPGRERPWRLVSTSQSIPRGDLDPQQRAAVDAFGQVFVEREFERLRSRLAHSPADSAVAPDPGHAPSLYGVSTWVTDDELAGLVADLRAVADRYLDRLEDPRRRPPDAHRARLFFAVSPDPRESATD